MRIYSQDIGMEFSMEKCAMEIRKSGKRQMTEGIKRPNQEKNRILEEIETNKYLGILEADTIKHSEMKEKKKNTSGGRENYPKSNCIAKISSKE